MPLFFRTQTWNQYRSCSKMELSTISRYRCCSKNSNVQWDVYAMHLSIRWHFFLTEPQILLDFIREQLHYIGIIWEEICKIRIKYVSLVDWISNGRHLIEFNEIKADFFHLNYLKVDFSRKLEKTATHLTENLNLIESNIDFTIRWADKLDITTFNNAINGSFDNFLEVSLPLFHNYSYDYVFQTSKLVMFNINC